eukprot:scaffold49657_cov65-Phaeocystis_antarctica.AAC.9
MAATPTPEAAAWISTVSPAAAWPSCRLSAAVSQASGTVAACAHDRARGLCITVAVCTDTYSAYPPPGTSAITRSPTWKPRAAAPRATTTPATSRPRTSVTPLGTGDLPRRCIVSSRLIAVATTRMSTSSSASALGTGHGFVTQVESTATTAVIVAGTSPTAPLA